MSGTMPPPTTTDWQAVEVDPQGADALALLREAAIEARALYPEIHTDPRAPWPTNAPTPPRGVYLVVYAQGRAVGMGAHRPLDATTTEIRRMYVLQSHRRFGVARILLAALERHAAAQGFTHLRLETGYRQQPAMRLYTAFGFVRIAPFGAYADDPSSVCFEKAIGAPPGPPPLPRVGVGVLVLRDGRVLLGKRRGAHGAGTWSAPGGRLEHGESFEDCARRELREETGLELGPAVLGPTTNDLFPELREHYVTVLVIARQASGVPDNREPHKCEGWSWFAWDALPSPLFAPLQTLVDANFRPERWS